MNLPVLFGIHLFSDVQIKLFIMCTVQIIAENFILKNYKKVSKL